MTSNEKRRLVETAILEEADAAAKELVVAFFNGGGATSHFPSDEVETALDQAFDIFYAFKQRKIEQLRETLRNLEDEEEASESSH
jgi:hypothetical protein